MPLKPPRRYQGRRHTLAASVATVRNALSRPEIAGDPNPRLVLASIEALGFVRCEPARDSSAFATSA